MIRSEFVIENNNVLSFSVTGHAGLAPAPHDILCASVSAMSQLVINTLEEVFGAELDLVIDEEEPRIAAKLVSVSQENREAVLGVMKGFYLQLADLEKMYPTHLSVRTKK
ncbi:MAG: ribosomal-processing cysteine protease Prp [Clostridia bacterium]|nr:ribosomal-processing cysteine protease Prp [Clostridia bacterium]